MKAPQVARETGIAGGERRFVLFVSARATPSTWRGLRRLLEAAELGDGVRVESVNGVEEVLRKLRPGEEEIPVAAGGDGTANLVAQALHRRAASPLLGILPLGTGNALAHALGVGRLSDAVAALRAGRAQPLDVMVTDNPAVGLALASLSAGFEGRFLADYARLRHWGRLVAGVIALPRAGRCHDSISLTADRHELASPAQPVFSAGLYNISCYAGGRRICRSADPGDGVAEAIVCATGWSYWRTLREGLEVEHDDVASCQRRARRWQHATLECSGPIQFDGEWAAGGSFGVRLEPAGVRVLVPPG